MHWNATCANCHKNFTSINDYSTHRCEDEWKNANKDTPSYQYYKEEKKMTREEAVNKLNETVFGYRGQCKSLSDTASKWIEVFEALGLLKFDEPKKPEPVVAVIVEVDENYNTSNNWSFYAAELVKKYERVRLELWPEGLVLWVGGEIKWKSWVDYYKTGDTVAIRNTNSDNILGFIK